MSSLWCAKKLTISFAVGLEEELIEKHWLIIGFKKSIEYEDAVGTNFPEVIASANSKGEYSLKGTSLVKISMETIAKDQISDFSEYFFSFNNSGELHLN